MLGDVSVGRDEISPQRGLIKVYCTLLSCPVLYCNCASQIECLCDVSWNFQKSSLCGCDVCDIGKLVTVFKVILSQTSLRLSSDNPFEQFRYEGQVRYCLG